MHIRSFAPDDYDQVLAIWSEAGLTITASDALPELLKTMGRNPDLFVLAEHDGGLVGAVVGVWDGRRGWVSHLAVRPAVQHRGIGSALMREVERRLRERGALKINLVVEQRNSDVVRFYERLGYRVGDVIFMGKELGGPAQA